jgi:lipoprotein-releasing system permease protein
VKLKLIGRFTYGRFDYDANIAIVDIKTADRLFRRENTVSGIGIKVQDEMKVGDLKKTLMDKFDYTYNIKSWMDLDRNLVTALALEKKMMFVILAMIVMVACFNICGSLIMMIMEKTKDIGILKAIGASSMGVSFVFLFQGIFIGLMGVLLGGAAGVFLAERINVAADILEQITGVTVFPDDIYYFTQIPVAISNNDVLTVIIVAFTLVITAGIYPAWKASRLDPVAAIRYE